MKLREQYQRLHQFMQSVSAQPGLPALATALHCSERNMRLLLSKMQTHGWLEWSAGRGRGNLSTLRLLAAPEELALDHLNTLLAKGDLEHAFASLNKRQRAQLTTRLPDYLGVPDSSCRSLRMPSFRRVIGLDPLEAYGRLESHLVRQIFARLTYFDPLTKRLAAGIAHHWESEKNASVWHFWLRPGLIFHDGSPLDSEDVRVTFFRLRDQAATFQALYKHLVKIESGHPHRVSFYLSRPDNLWPHCLAMANSSIVPRQRKTNFEHMPIGSGAFRVSRHNHYQLTLSTFKDYYKQRPLLDEIDLWMLEPPDGADTFDLQFGFGASNQCERKVIEFAEVGSSFIICNPNKSRFKSIEQRRAFTDFLSPHSLIPRGERSRQPASGLLAEWKHIKKRRDVACPIKPGQKLHMVSGQSKEVIALGELIEAALIKAGIKIEWTQMPFKDLIRRDWLADADFVVGREIMQDDLDFACFEMFSGDSIFRRWMSDAARRELDLDLQKIQAEPSSETRMRAYAEIGERLVQQAWIAPFSHEFQQVSVAAHVAGVRITTFGFVEFDEMWLRN